MKKKVSFFAVLLIFFPFAMQASRIVAPFIQADAGVSLSKIGETQNVPWRGCPSYYDRYVSTSDNNISFTGGLHGGLSIRPLSRILLQVGFGVYQAINNLAKGKVIEDAGPGGLNAYNFNYRYTVSSFRALLEGRIFFIINSSAFYGTEGVPYVTPYPYIAPYIAAGFGYTHIVANGFNLKELTPGWFKDAFGSHTAENSAFQLGGGISVQLNPHVGLLVGYRYVDEGKARLGTGPGTIPLNVGTVSSHEVVGGLLYMF